jgi:hypothetical protein
MEKSRLSNFIALKSHAWLKRLFIKLNKKELELCYNFIKSTYEDSNNEYASKVNRMFLDKEKPKSWKEIQELLLCSI